MNKYTDNATLRQVYNHLVVVPAGDWMYTEAITARDALERPAGTRLATFRGGGGPAAKRNQAIENVLADHA